MRQRPAPRLGFLLCALACVAHAISGCGDEGDEEVDIGCNCFDYASLAGRCEIAGPTACVAVEVTGPHPFRCELCGLDPKTAPCEELVACLEAHPEDHYWDLIE
jgi:hypothetical protein